MEEKEPEMAFYRIDTFDAHSLPFFCLLSGENATHCLSYPIYEPLPIIHTHTIVMFVLSLYAFLF